MQLQPKMSLSLRTFIFLSAIYAVSINGQEMNCRKVIDCEIYQDMEYEIETKCDEGICQCSIDSKPIECVLRTTDMSVYVFGSCPCGMPFSECKSGVCFCKDGYRPSKDMRRCIPRIVPIGSKCEADEQCQELDIFSVCTHSKCECRKSFAQIQKGKCYSVIDRWEICHSSNDCSKSHPHTKCDSKLKRCFCEQDYVYEEYLPGISYEPFVHDCLRIADWGQRCKMDAQCQEKLGIGGNCDDYNECHCRAPYIIKWMQEHPIIMTMANASFTKYSCVLPVDFGDFCAVDEDCLQPKVKGILHQPMHCFLNQCLCKYGYESEDVLACKKSSGRNLIVPMRFVFLGIILHVLTQLYYYVKFYVFHI